MSILLYSSIFVSILEHVFSQRTHRTGLGCWVSRRPKRFFTVTRCRENLSSGEKRAGWAEVVLVPSGLIFCGDKEEGTSSLAKFSGKIYASTTCAEKQKTLYLN